MNRTSGFPGFLLLLRVFAVLYLADFALHAVLRTERENCNRPAALFAGTGKKSLVLATTAGCARRWRRARA